MAQALTALLLIAALAACGRAKEEAAAATQEARGFVLTRSLAGKTEWKLESPLAVFDEKSNKANLETPKVGLYKAGRRDTDAQADQGEIDLRTHDMELTGKVRVENPAEKITVATDQLLYVSGPSEFRTERPVEIRRPEGVMRGRGLTANGDLSVIRVHQQETRVE